MLVYEINVAPAVDADVVTRRLSITVNGEHGGEHDAPGTTVRFGGLKFNDGDEVELHLVDIDDAGNHSPPAVHRFTAADTIAPATPGGFGVALVAEMPNEPAPTIPAVHVTAHDKTEGKGDGNKAVPAGGGDDDTDAPAPGRGRK